LIDETKYKDDLYVGLINQPKSVFFL